MSGFPTELNGFTKVGMDAKLKRLPAKGGKLSWRYLALYLPFFSTGATILAVQIVLLAHNKFLIATIDNSNRKSHFHNKITISMARMVYYSHSETRAAKVLVCC